MKSAFNKIWKEKAKAKATAMWIQAYIEGCYTLDLTGQHDAESRIARMRNYLCDFRIRVRKKPLEHTTVFEIINCCEISVKPKTVLQIRRKQFARGGCANFLMLPDVENAKDSETKKNLVLKNLRNSVLTSCNEINF